MDQNIYFYIPGIVQLFEINFILVKRLNEHPEHFYDNVKIGGIFGSIPGAIWNGGRLEAGNIADEHLKLLETFHKETNIPFRWTWTNPVLEKRDLKDRYCNYITNMFEDGINEILVNNDIMEKYIRKNYPKYPIISSTTKRITSLEKLNKELSKDYKLVVLDYDFNNQWELLNQIQHPEKCEILINPICNPKCPFRIDHYKAIGYLQKGDNTKRNEITENCPAQYRMMNEIKDLPGFVSREDLYNKYVPNGFRHFKIEGRSTCPLKPIEWYLYYMVKPEYYDEERAWLHMAFETVITNPNIPIYLEEPNNS